ncbi:MAG: CVNH domain-containing protein [Oligoflexales bacterium]
MLSNIFSIGIIALALSANVFANEDISQTCEDFTIEGNEVSAYCRDQAGDFTKTTIVIHGVENINGNLTKKNNFRPAGFHNSCNEISIDDYGIISASCKSRDGSWFETSLDLEIFVMNDNGKLIDIRFPN